LSLHEISAHGLNAWRMLGVLSTIKGIWTTWIFETTKSVRIQDFQECGLWVHAIDHVKGEFPAISQEATAIGNPVALSVSVSLQ